MDHDDEFKLPGWVWVIIAVVAFGWWFFGGTNTSSGYKTKIEQQPTLKQSQLNEVKDELNNQQDQIDDQDRKQEELENKIQEQESQRQNDQFWNEYCSSEGEYYNGTTCSKR